MSSRVSQSAGQDWKGLGDLIDLAQAVLGIGKGRLRVTTQLEELCSPLTSEHLVALGVNT